jgi:subtilisin family serine protease
MTHQSTRAARAYAVLLIVVLAVGPRVAGAQSPSASPTPAEASPAPAPTNATRFLRVTVPEIRSIEAAKSRRTDAQKKVSSELLDRIARAGARDDDVLVDIFGTVTEELRDAVRSVGTIIGSYPSPRSVRARVHLSGIMKLASRSDVTAIERAVQPSLNATFVDEADVAHTAAEARNTLKATGANVTIGVISDSATEENLQKAFDDTDLDPEMTSVIPEFAAAGGDEGIAIMEVIHALAPRARLVFASGAQGADHMASAIHELWSTYNCNIIVDDITYADEPPFQDGIISRAVNAASAAGVLYFSSARNSGNVRAGTSGTWEGWFEDGGPGSGAVSGRQHVFTSQDGRTRLLYDTIVKDRDSRIDLFWNDPLPNEDGSGGSVNGYNLYVVDPTTQEIIASSTTANGIPYQTCCETDKNGKPFTPRRGDRIVITRDPSAQTRYLHLDTGRDVLQIATGGTVRGHNASAAPNAFSVGAISAQGLTESFTAGSHLKIEDSSADGPRRMFFQPDGTPMNPGTRDGTVFRKPDFAAADCVDTAIDSLRPFCGTSAAAPHAAAIAALVLSAHPGMSPARVREALNASALRIGGSARDDVAGAGVVMAVAALREAARLSGSP